MQCGENATGHHVSGCGKTGLRQTVEMWKARGTHKATEGVHTHTASAVPFHSFPDVLKLDFADDISWE